MSTQHLSGPLHYGAPLREGGEMFTSEYDLCFEPDIDIEEEMDRAKRSIATTRYEWADKVALLCLAAAIELAQVGLHNYQLREHLEDEGHCQVFVEALRDVIYEHGVVPQEPEPLPLLAGGAV